MKILLTDPFLDGQILIDEISYWLNSENYSIERPMVPRRQYSHHYKKYFIILAFVVESNVEVDVLRLKIECSYKPSA
jgi:hypothetical protein